LITRSRLTQPICRK